MQPSQFDGLSPEDAAALAETEVKKLYQRKEIEFPVSVGLSHFMVEQNGLARYNRAGLAEWANGRFALSIAPEEIESKSKADITQMLLETSSQFMARGERVIARFEELLNTAYGHSSSHDHSRNGATRDRAPNAAAIKDIVDLAKEEFGVDLIPDELAKLDRTAVERDIRNHYERKYRYEIHHAERSVALETLDTAWKDHLYDMDHLKAGIGLAGYAQKDPKVEYRREGMKDFERMWDKIASQVTGTIFRIAVEIPEPTADRWQITSQVHESPAEDIPDDHPALEQQGGANRPASGPAIEPIRNFGNRVGRNDPCPCGSGKKYKKCHGAN